MSNKPPRGAAHVHGLNGLGDIATHLHAKATTRPVDPKQCSAAQFIVDSCRARPGEVVILALAPLTNLALALLLEPQLPKLVKRVYIMAGALASAGNVTPLAEANGWLDRWMDGWMDGWMIDAITS